MGSLVNLVAGGVLGSLSTRSERCVVALCGLCKAMLDHTLWDLVSDSWLTLVCLLAGLSTFALDGLGRTVDGAPKRFD